MSAKPIPTREAERTFTGNVIGCDEVGRGCLFGPVVVCACFVPLDVHIEGVRDSKLMTSSQRERAYDELIHHPRVRYVLTERTAAQIDEVNILQATMDCMLEAVKSIRRDLEIGGVLVDGNRVPEEFRKDPEFSNLAVRAIPKGDQKCYCIAAASVIAKVTRDRMMTALDKVYPVYGLAQHKGYPTKVHKEALKKYGPTPLHRQSFSGVVQ